MINILTAEHGKQRCEAARIILPGFESFELFATPYWNPETSEFEEDNWVVTEATSGTRIGPDVGYETIELATECTIAWLATRKITPAILQRAIERFTRDNTTTVAP